MNTADDWKREADTGRCRHCRGLGYLPATYSRGAEPCGCDEPQVDDDTQPGIAEAMHQTRPSHD
jgi:hypothetical protein